MASWTRWRQIGSGAFGDVILAVDNFTGKPFAVKSVQLDSPHHAQLENEIAILKSLASPYVVRYLGDDADGSRRNLHLELMVGGSLADVLAAKKGSRAALDEGEVRAYALCVGRALRYLHDVAGVVHCDVKGRNVLIGEAPGVAKLADFGAAVRTSDGSVKGNGGARGTPLWMAPEVARGERPRPASDVWSFGCMVIEMITGLHPWPEFERAEPEAAMFHIGYGEELPEFPPYLSKLGKDFLDKCLRKSPSERWTAEQLLQHPFLAEEGIFLDNSPRGVLEWANWDFDGDNCGSDCSSSLSTSADSITPARDRVKELASCSKRLSWDDDGGWEEIRSAEEVNLAEDGKEEVTAEVEALQHCTCFSVQMENIHRRGSATASAANACCSRYCNGGGVWHRQIGLNTKLLVGWCELFFRLKMIINTYDPMLSPFV
ncbi:mitogen-activated protein kinase kinase kinase 18-like [Curcuma longa]|uniref:mitogen-activated protein kinase kinase kinase 18-like n=1 Tax=Curcuma longa TaxID=136217 RepID=UPI003D9E0B55